MFNIFKKDNDKCTDIKCDGVIDEEDYNNLCNTMNDFRVSAKDMADKILNISKIIIEKDNEIIKLQNNIDRIMSCRDFIVEGYEVYDTDEGIGKQDRIYLGGFGDELKQFLTKDYYDKMHKLEDDIKELKNKLIEN